MSHKKALPSATQLVELYQSEEVLWNIHNSDYFNKRKRRNALERIGAIIGITAEEVKSKLRNMRTYYNAEKKKIENAGKREPGTDDVIESSWPLFNLLDKFLSDIVVRRPTKSNQDEVAVDNTFIGTDADDDEDDFLSQDKEDDTESHDEMTSIYSGGPLKRKACSNPKRQPSKKRITEIKVQRAIILAGDSLESVRAGLAADERTAPFLVDDDAALFSKIVEADFRKIKSRRVRHNIKMKVMDLLFQGTLEDEMYGETVAPSTSQPRHFPSQHSSGPMNLK
ncbi:uncharacterized protein LOC117108245 [Anneissia japonica]|uniref:uncharacterized protein LOC117108245 n=1 Tax=Anneissia japonica TaxID=1529436 RepID=UPI001425521B|nr:uncharacterized protein LOC117108245 [Anneissia japonica]